MDASFPSPNLNPPVKPKPPEPPKPAPTEPVREVHYDRHDRGQSSLGFGRILFGGLLILVGLAYLGNSLGWFTVDVDIWQLWPLMIIFLGLSILSRHGWISWVVGSLITLVVLGGVAYVVFVGSPAQRTVTTETIAVAKEAGAEQATLDIDAGAGSLTLQSGATDAVNGTFESNVTTVSKTSSLTNTTQAIGFNMRGHWRGFGSTKNSLDLKLNQDLLYEVNVDSGAMDMNLDLAEIKLTKLTVDTGASSLNLDLGDRVDRSDVLVKAGASSVDISLPKTVGARVDVQAGLTSKDLEDFTKIGDTTYESANYGSAEKKISIELDLGVSSLNVHWR